MVITRTVDVVVNIRFRNRRAKKVTSLDRELHFLAHRREWRRTSNLYFELRLFVLLHFEVSGGTVAARFGLDVIGPERCFVGDVHLAAERAARRQRQFPLEDLSVVGIFNIHRDGLAVD